MEAARPDERVRGDRRLDGSGGVPATGRAPRPVARPAGAGRIDNRAELLPLLRDEGVKGDDPDGPRDPPLNPPRREQIRCRDELQRRRVVKRRQTWAQRFDRLL